MTDESRTERAGMVPFGDLETAIKREVEFVAERFPDTDVAVVDGVVREVFAELRADATVETLLLPVSHKQAIDRLEAMGHRFDPPISDTPADATPEP